MCLSSFLKYLQNLSSSLSKSSRRLWNSPRLSRLELILCTQKRLFLVYKRLLHQILPINENTSTWFDILAVQKCQLHCFQFGSARLAMWIVTCSARFSSVRLSSACSVNEPLTWALDGGEWSTSRHGHFTSGKNPSTHWIGGWVGPRASLDNLEKGIISCSFTGENQSTRTKNYPSATSSAINPTWLTWDWNRDFVETVHQLTAQAMAKPDTASQSSQTTEQ